MFRREYPNSSRIQIAWRWQNLLGRLTHERNQFNHDFYCAMSSQSDYWVDTNIQDIVSSLFPSSTHIAKCCIEQFVHDLI